MNRRLVIDAVVTHLEAQVTHPVGDLTAPNPAPAIYHVVEQPPGTMHDGPIGAPGAELRLVVRVRTVAKHTSLTLARQAAQDAADQAETAMVSRATDLVGTGWAASGRRLVADSGAFAEGPVVNIARDYELRIARA